MERVGNDAVVAADDMPLTTLPFVVDPSAPSLPCLLRRAELQQRDRVAVDAASRVRDRDGEREERGRKRERGKQH